MKLDLENPNHSSGEWGVVEAAGAAVAEAVSVAVVEVVAAGDLVVIKIV